MIMGAGEKIRLIRRSLVDKAALGFMVISTVLTICVLGLILGYVIIQGSGYINWSFLTSLPTPVGEGGGGIANALVGSLIVVGIASLMAVPIGVGAAVFANEYRSRWLGWFVRFLADVFTGVPAIVVGLFAYAMVVQPMGSFSAFSGSVAYAFLMIPILVISAQEALRLVPNSIREASLALGVPVWKTILRIVLPTCSRALMTGLLLAFARALGEASPMLFTAFGNSFWNVDLTKPIATVPLVIYRYAVAPYDDWHAQAWAASLILVFIVLIASSLTRLAFRSRLDD
ncbi:MAG: phosphate ABC transporter permease PstA [Alphaproteobacteria bacterium]|nr:phosphate ABC transporter permease PstA [Alphaproteobacteria bacterium]